MRPSRALVLGTTAAGLVLAQGMVVPASAGDWQPEAPPAGTGFWSNACSTDDHAGVHTALQDDDRSLAATRTFVDGGGGDVAWRFDPAASVQGGPVVTIGSPKSVQRFTVQARSDGGLSGRVLVFYQARGADNGDYYVGEAAVSGPAGDWQTLDASSGLRWWHHTVGVLTKKPRWSAVNPGGLLGLGGGNDPLSLSEFAAKEVDGGRMLAAYQLGCNGQPFDLDHLRVTTGSGTTDYDLSNQSSRTTLSASAAKVGAGGAVTLTGRVIGAFSNGTPAGGTVELRARPYGAAAFSTIDTGAPGSRFTVRPTGTTTYQLHYSGSPAARQSTSGTVTVQVAARISAKLATTRVVRGGKVTLTGKVAPATAGVPVSLQRHVGKKWKTLATTRSTAGGAYSVAATARGTGAWTVRAVAHSVRGNLSGTSPTRKLTVRNKTRVSLALSKASVLRGTKYTLRGTARPHKKGVRVTLQRRVGHKWVKVATTKTTKKGTFVFKRRAGAPGTTTYRVVVAGWGLNNAGVSPTRTQTVRVPAPPPPPPAPPTGDGGGTGIGGGGGTGIG